MFKVSTTGFGKELFPELTRYIQTLPDTLAEDALEIAVELEAELEAIYKTAPPRGNRPFVWSADPAKNAQGRRTWFWLVKTGKVQTDGKHYKRQGKPPYGAKVYVEQSGNGRVVIVFAQTWEKSSMIFGKLNGGDTRLPGHKSTGWSYAFPKYKRAQNLFLKELDSRVLARLRGANKR